MLRKRIEIVRSVYQKNPGFITEDLEVALEDAYRVNSKTVVENGIPVLAVCRYRADNIAIPFVIMLLDLIDLVRAMSEDS